MTQQYGAIVTDIEKEDNGADWSDPQISQRNGRKWIAGFGIGLLVTSLLLLYANGTGDFEQNGAFLLSSMSHHDENDALFYNDQLVDHFNDADTRAWSNRYYKSTKYFGGPGKPIFLVIGGEGALDHGMLYPFVTDVLAKRFQAAVLQIEHRFYGPYHPIPNATNDELLDTLTPHQAMADMIQLTQHVRYSEFGCSPHRSSARYCPIVSVGGSYPGFLSALFRIVYPNVVDIAYASSAPLLMYAQEANQDVYYDIVTESAEQSSPGCATAVKKTLLDMVDTVDAAASLHEAAKHIGICADRLPAYIKTKDMLRDAVIQITSFSFADYDMNNYPPGPDTGMFQACALFQNDDMDTLETLGAFFDSMLEQEEQEEKGCDMHSVSCDDDDDTSAKSTDSCFNLMSQLPGGSNSTLEDTDGDYEDGKMWDFQTCTHLIFLIGFSRTSMFPAHESTYQHLADHCYDRFGVTPQPTELVEKWDFINKLSNGGASNILFTNGLQDMWSGGSVLDNMSETILAINFENGAHHSDLSHQGPGDKDTKDINQGYVQISNILAKWLDQIKQ